MNPREQRGVVIAALCKLAPNNGQWVVPSQTVSDRRYSVNVQAGTCTCPDQQETGFKCKHLYAVEFTMKREQDLFGNITETRTMTFTEKKVYRQNWPLYNQAQHVEKHRLQGLLADLCRGIAEPPAAHTGRTRTPIADRLFSAVFKVYCSLSCRRSCCDLMDAHAKGHLSKTLNPDKASHFLCESDLTVPLTELVVRSSLPLTAVETDFAVDSTGFSTSRFCRWFDEKYGTERKAHDWLKVHIACGVKTGIVTAIKVTNRDVNDCPVLPQLAKTTAKSFKVNEVSADKGYLSVDNVEVIAALGGTPFIAPKLNTTGGKGGLFEKMFHFYQYQRETFMEHYHKRSNVESVFSAVKRKFGDALRSRNDVAMVNEALAKFLCHNLCVVIQSQCELGIDAEFWPEENQKDVLTMATA